MPKGSLLICANQCREQLITITTYLIVSIIVSLVVHSNRQAGVRGDYPNIRGYKTYHPLPLIQNVSCIAHDAKYTCDCSHNTVISQEFLLPPLQGSVYQLEIINCESLTVNANVLKDLQGLRKITFKSVHNLILNKYSLAYPLYASNTPLILTFEEVNITLIDSHSISGIIEEISFTHGYINTINPFGFTILRDHALLLKMENITINRIESQAFKKFIVEQIDIKNCTFLSNLPSKTFYEVEVQNILNIQRVQFPEMHSKAFSFKMISKLMLIDNNFQAVDGEWLEVLIRESIIIRGNHFGNTSEIAFRGITVHRDYMASEFLELRFINNTVHFPSEVQPLIFRKELSLTIKQLQYENHFECFDVDTTEKPHQPKSTFFQLYQDFIFFYPHHNANSFIALRKFIELNCQTKSYWLFILLSGIGIVIIIITIGCLVWYGQRKKRKRLKMDIVQPEPRTYKETQIVYQIENAGLLKTDL